MICPFCGEEILFLEVVEQVTTFLRYMVSKKGTEDGSMYREGDSDTIRVYAQTPCCGGVIDLRAFHEAEDIAKESAILLPEDNEPEPISVGGRKLYCVKYRGKIYARTHLLSTVEAYESEHMMWTESGGYVLLMFYEWDAFLKTWVNPDDKEIRSPLLKKRIEELATEITDKDLVIPP